MQIGIVIEALFHEPHSELAFLKEFDTRKNGNLMRFIFDEPNEAARAVEFLNSTNIEHQILFRFSMTRDELCSYPALYLGVPSLYAINRGVIDPAACDQCELFSDYGTGWLCASNGVRTLLRPLLSSADYTPLPSTDLTKWFRINVRGRLHHPIKVVAPIDVFADEQESDRVSVRGDGRSVIEDTDAALVCENGIAIAECCCISGIVHAWEPRLICSGLVMATLLDNRIPGVPELPLPVLLKGSAWADIDAGSNLALWPRSSS